MADEMILVIDNYDSFVFNLSRYVVELGYEVCVYRNDALTLDAIESLRPSHIILSPGPCSPDEAGISLDLIKRFTTTPILGVCLGHQAIAQAYGGKVMRAQFPKHGKAEQIYHNGEGVFVNLPNPLTVARYHSLIVENESLPGWLKVTATTTRNEIMAIEHKEHPVVGVQFHPESILTQCGHELLQAFLTIY